MAGDCPVWESGLPSPQKEGSGHSVGSRLMGLCSQGEAANSYHGAEDWMIMCCEPRYRAQCCSRISDAEAGKPRCESLQRMRFCSSHGRDSGLGNPFLQPPRSHPQSQLPFHAPVPSPFICAAKIAVDQDVNLTSVAGCFLF